MNFTRKYTLALLVLFLIASCGSDTDIPEIPLEYDKRGYYPKKMLYQMIEQGSKDSEEDFLKEKFSFVEEASKDTVASNEDSSYDLNFIPSGIDTQRAHFLLERKIPESIFAYKVTINKEDLPNFKAELRNAFYHHYEQDTLTAYFYIDINTQVRTKTPPPWLEFSFHFQDSRRHKELSPFSFTVEYYKTLPSTYCTSDQEGKSDDAIESLIDKYRSHTAYKALSVDTVEELLKESSCLQKKKKFLRPYSEVFMKTNYMYNILFFLRLQNGLYEYGYEGEAYCIKSIRQRNRKYTFDYNDRNRDAFYNSTDVGDYLRKAALTAAEVGECYEYY